MLYGVKPDLAKLRAFGAPCAIVGPSEKFKKRTWTVGWAINASMGAWAVKFNILRNAAREL